MSAPSKLSFLRVLVLPAALLFVLPAFGVWFANHASRSYDEQVFDIIFPQIDKDAELTPAERAKAKAFYKEVPPSIACVVSDDELAAYRDSLGEGCSDFRQFAYARLASVLAFGIGVFAVVVALLCALCAFVSRRAQYVSFVIGWNVLKVIGAVEAVLQGALLVWLSFWMTALWAELYVVKLILVAAAVAAVAMFKVIVAIFRRPEGGVDVEGERVSEAAAPELWARVRELCAELGTTPPDHIVAGIDDNFFVTEGQVRLDGNALSGRVLYVSLSLLRTLHRSEADAVLAHEMAHLLGGDTGHSKKLAPLIARFVQYLQALHEGFVTRPIYYFMRAYFGVFQLAVSKSRRAAEFAADAAAARVTSPLDIARSLIKVGAYSSYRGRVEEKLFEHDAVHGELGIAARVQSGFNAYARTEALHFDLHESVTPHPFDSHPELKERIAHVGIQLEPGAYEQVLVEPVVSTWVDAISTAPDIENRLWTAYEQRFAAAHDVALAYRYQPSNEDEKAHVEKYFPAVTFTGKEEGHASMTYSHIGYFEWDGPVRFADIAGAAVEDRMFKKYLDLKLNDGGRFGGATKKSVCLSKLADGDAVLACFSRYYGRHQMMVQHQAQTRG
jgi:Zn-dependent protease with chaperone function